VAPIRSRGLFRCIKNTSIFLIKIKIKIFKLN
jgi:hypothetical protein